MFEKRDAGEFRRLQTPALQKLARRPDEALDVDEDEPLASARRSCLRKGVQARFEGYEHLPYESSHWDRTVETSSSRLSHILAHSPFQSTNDRDRRLPDGRTRVALGKSLTCSHYPLRCQPFICGAAADLPDLQDRAFPPACRFKHKDCTSNTLLRTC